MRNAFDVYSREREKKRAKAMWSLRHTRVERAVHSPPLFFFFFLNIKLFFHFPFFGVNDNTTTRQHISRGGTLLFPEKVKKRNKKTQLKEESNLLAKNEKN